MDIVAASSRSFASGLVHCMHELLFLLGEEFPRKNRWLATGKPVGFFFFLFLLLGRLPRSGWAAGRRRSFFFFATHTIFFSEGEFSGACFREAQRRRFLFPL